MGRFLALSFMTCTVCELDSAVTNIMIDISTYFHVRLKPQSPTMSSRTLGILTWNFDQTPDKIRNLWSLRQREGSQIMGSPACGHVAHDEYHAYFHSKYIQNVFGDWYWPWVKVDLDNDLRKSCSKPLPAAILSLKLPQIAAMNTELITAVPETGI